MVRFITLLLLCCFGQICLAQSVTVSEELTLRSDEGYALLGKYQERILLFRSEPGDKFEVQSFDDKLRMSWKKDITLDKKNPNLIEVIPLQESFVIIYSYRLRGNLFLKAAKYDAAANLRDSITFKNLGSSWYAPKVNLAASENRKKVVLYSVEKQSFLNLYAFDLAKMELTWENVIRPDRLIEQKDLEEQLVDNQGNFYYIQEKDNRKSRLDEHRYEIYACKGGGENDRITKIIQMVEDLTYEVLWKVDNINKWLVAGGLYSENNRARANGYFTLRANCWGDSEIFHQKNEFEESFIRNISGKGIDEEKGVSEITVRQMILRRDGGFMMFLERAKTLERRMSSGAAGYAGRSGPGYIVDYYFDDIIAISLNPDGTVYWKDVFHKKQYSQDDGAVFSSFYALATPSRIRLIFNDDIKNETTVSEYVLRADGQADRNSLLATDDQDIRLRFQDALQVSANEFIVPSERRNRLKLVRVAY